MINCTNRAYRMPSDCAGSLNFPLRTFDGKCPSCGHKVQVRMDGKIQRHKPKGSTTQVRNTDG
jgi:hypothetical protein